MTIAIQARHRSARRPITPLTTMTQAAAQGLSTAGRRTAAVAVSSGLIASLVGGAPAFAADVVSSGTDVQALTTAALESLDTAPTVVVAQDAVWTTDDAALKIKAAPEPVIVPPVTVSVVRTPVASRSASRTPIRTTSNDSSSSSSSSSKSTDTSAKSSSKDNASSNDSSNDSSDSGFGAKITSIAERYIGVPYVYGGTTPSGFDCSGFTSYVFAKLGIDLPRTSSAQRYAGKVVSAKDARAGDIIWTPGHVAIYLGNGKQIDAPRPGKTIQVRSIWQSNPTFIRVG